MNRLAGQEKLCTLPTGGSDNDDDITTSRLFKTTREELIISSQREPEHDCIHPNADSEDAADFSDAAQDGSHDSDFEPHWYYRAAHAPSAGVIHEHRNGEDWPREAKNPSKKDTYRRVSSVRYNQ